MAILYYLFGDIRFRNKPAPPSAAQLTWRWRSVTAVPLDALGSELG